MRTRFHAPCDSNEDSILCFPGRNGKNIPRSGPLESVFTDCGRTLVTEGTENQSFGLPDDSAETAEACQVASGHFPLQELIELRRLDPLPLLHGQLLQRLPPHFQRWQIERQPAGTRFLHDDAVELDRLRMPGGAISWGNSCRPARILVRMSLNLSLLTP